MDPIQASYDQHPYQSHAFSETHPEQLRTTAILFGLESPPAERCRVLELGCAGGGNLFPMAWALPESRFIGVDLSGRQIEDARQAAIALNLANIDFKAMSLTEIDRDFGEFDYIICHGVFSWVPRHVQDKILQICRENLAPNGVAFVSYNTYPGWHIRGPARDLMAYHAQLFAEAPEKVRQAKAALKLASESPLLRNNPAAAAYKIELDYVNKKSEYYVLHEHLEEYNAPLYFHQFMERAQQVQLQHLSDARHRGLLTEESLPQFADLFRHAKGDLVRIEQYADFLRNQSFRRSLLCHAAVKLDRASAVERISRLSAVSALPRDPSGGTIPSSDKVRFGDARRGYVESTSPLVKAALLHLNEVFPQAVPFEELLSRAAGLINMSPATLQDHRPHFSQVLLRFWLLNMIGLHISPPRPQTRISSTPTVSPVARYLAQQVGQVTNLRHDSINLDAVYRKVVQYLDGTRTREQIIEAILNDGLAHAQAPPGTNPQVIREATIRGVDNALKLLARQAMLVG